MNLNAKEKTTGTPNKIEVISPLDGKKIGEVPAFDIEAARRKLAETRLAQAEWAKTPFSRRRQIMREFLKLFANRADEVAELLSRETGKTLYESKLFEIMPIIHHTAYFADRAEKILAPRRIFISLFKHRASYLHYRPRGVVLIVAPWNFPLVIPVGEAVMALMAGNGVLLKPSSLTPLIAYKLKEIFDEAGLAPHLLQIVSGPGRMASELIESGVDYVNFTGSTAVGKQVAELCGKKMIPCSMELGGKAPFIVTDDADIEAAAAAAVWGAFANSGQICASVERVYLNKRVYDRFVNRAVEITKKLRQGNPFEKEVDIGAMTDPKQIKIIEEMIEEARSRGARILTGGRRSPAGEHFFEPTIIVDADESMKVGREESFGPLMTIMKVENDEEAIRRANDSRYGLIAYVFSGSGSRARRIAERIEAGTVMINEVLMTHAFPEVPWQGVKESGIGRVHSDEGLRDLAYPYHVNYDLLPIKLPVRYPYNLSKADKFLKIMRAISVKA